MSIFRAVLILKLWSSFHHSNTIFRWPAAPSQQFCIFGPLLISNMRKLIFIGFLFAVQFSFAQQLGTLTVEKIMRDPKWIGTSPSNPSWSTDGKYLFFSWNPEGADSDSTYYVTLSNPVPQKASFAFRQSVAMENNSVWNKNHDAYVFSRSGDLFYFNTKDQKQIRITQTEDNESNPRFIEGDKRINYRNRHPGRLCVGKQRCKSDSVHREARRLH